MLCFRGSAAVSWVSKTDFVTIDLTATWVVDKGIEFEHEDEEEIAESEQSKLAFIGPYAVDLLTGTTYPALPQINIDTGIYTDIEIDIEKFSASDIAGEFYLGRPHKP